MNTFTRRFLILSLSAASSFVSVACGVDSPSNTLRSGSTATGASGGGGAQLGTPGNPIVGGAAPLSFATDSELCGDGTKQEAEQCDDANKNAGDGCNTFCQLELDWVCPTEGQPCIYAVACGDGILASSEICDDGNAVAGDGCAADCLSVDAGWQCRVPGRQCIPLCGDAVITPPENCDDGNATSGDGCSSTCLTEPGWSCTGTTCIQSQCGNGVPETGESCDLGAEANGLFYGNGTGCSKTCTIEPRCRDESGVTGACSTACGDGNVDLGEDCDDGNGNDGDGCSALCTVEAGFMCSGMEKSDLTQCTSGAGNCLHLPIIFRDFDGEHEATGHPDFFHYSNTRQCVPNASGQEDPAGITSADCWSSDSTDLCPGLVQSALAADGKPAPGDRATCKCRYTDWDGTGIIPNANTCNSGGEAQPPRVEEDTQVIASPASFHQWYHDDATVSTTVLGTLELSPIGGNQFQFSSSNGSTVYDDIAQGAGSELSSGFFPLENQPRAKVCNIWPYWTNHPGCAANQWDPTLNDGAGNWVDNLQGIERNFYFTTEVRYLFRYQGGESLEFFGDDDVWVFINGVLVLDLGAPHERLSGSIALDTAGAAWEINGLNISTGAEIPIADGTSPPLNLEVGRIYEIAVFHADRHPRESNYQLTVSGFSTVQSACIPQCGDGAVTTGEECDDGAANQDGVYGGCSTMCRFGPFCGDGVVDAAGGEECDLGRDNTARYGDAGCTPGCRAAPRCGDGFIDAAWGEACDDGPNNGTSRCKVDCTPRLD